MNMTAIREALPRIETRECGAGVACSVHCLAGQRAADERLARMARAYHCQLVEPSRQRLFPDAPRRVVPGWECSGEDYVSFICPDGSVFFVARIFLQAYGWFAKEGSPLNQKDVYETRTTSSTIKLFLEILTGKRRQRDRLDNWALLIPVAEFASCHRAMSILDTVMRWLRDIYACGIPGKTRQQLMAVSTKALSLSLEHNDRQLYKAIGMQMYPPRLVTRVNHARTAPGGRPSVPTIRAVPPPYRA